MQRAAIDGYVLISLRVLMAFGFIIGLYLAFKIAFIYFLPIIIASIFSMFMEPLVRNLEKIKVPRMIGTLIAMIVFLGTVITISIFAISRAVTELTIFYKKIPEYSVQIYESLSQLIEQGKTIYLQLPPEALTILQQSVGSIFEKITALITTLTTGILNTLTSLPGILIFTLITLIATFFITKDKAMIKTFVLRQFSETAQNKVIGLKDDLFVALIGFVKAQLIFITVTFLESFLGLSIIGVPYAFIIALMIAIVDILPVLGTGTIYVPWAIFSLLNGNYVLGFSLLGLWVFIFVVRYIIEPKVYGYQLGIHPLLALIAVFAGLKLFGVVGLILGPATVVILMSCQKAGILPKFK
jgi:sporulation integral membrane protein YtvI